MTEEQLITRIKKGDNSAWDELLEMHRPLIHRQCSMYTQDSDKAEDLTQEVLLQVFKKLHTFKGKSKLSTWIHKITRNAYLMSVRRPKRVEFVPVEEVEIPIIDREQHILVEKLVLLELIRDYLPERQSQFVTLKYLHGMSLKEIAKMHGCCIGNVKSQTARGIYKLRKLFKIKTLHALKLEYRGSLEEIE